MLGRQERAEQALLLTLLDAAARFADSTTFGPGSTQLEDKFVAAQSTMRRGVPRGTASHDKWGFKWVVKVCSANKWMWMRPRHVPEHEQADEAWFLALVLAEIAPLLRASPRRAALGYTIGQPPSALQAIYGYRRVLRACGLFVCAMHTALAMLKGLVEEYKQDFGQDALAVRHHVPFSLDEVRRMIEALRRREIDGLSESVSDALIVVICFCMVRGPRLDEWVEKFRGDSLWRRASFKWAAAPKRYLYTREIAAHGPVAPGMLLRAVNPPSKTDRSGRKYGSKYMYYVKDEDNPINFAAEWERYELKYPCPPGKENEWPAFSPWGDHRPFIERIARRTFDILMRHVLGDELAAEHAWHDFRATVCSAMVGLKKKTAVIQGSLNWASAESVALYGQLTPRAKAQHAEDASRADGARCAHLPRPHVDHDTVLVDLQGCVDVLEEAQCAQRAKPKPAASKAVRARKAPRTAAKNESDIALAAPAHEADDGHDAEASDAAAAEAHALLAIDVGEGAPLAVDASHPLTGHHVSVANAVWEPDVGGVTVCEILGFAADESRGEHRGVFAIRDHKAGIAYAITQNQLQVFFTPRLKRLLGRRS